MNRSIFERIFPHSPSTVLPQYHDYAPGPSEAPSTPPRISLKASSSRSSSSSPKSARVTLKAAPLSASIIHHDDPFLPIERAANALQRNIQAFLDAQSAGLNTSIGGGDDLSSVGSPTPTPSVATPSRSHAGPRTVPIRQPLAKKISLRGARKGLAKAMEDLVRLKDEELQIIRIESRNRQSALQQTRTFEEKRQSLKSEINAIRSEDATTGATALRTEASRVEAEIHELENRLFELRARHRHLTSQADQLENSVDSKMSSYKSSLAIVEKDVKGFLKRPPILSSLSSLDDKGSTQSGIFALKPERRTLEMAQDQWTTEQNSLALHKADVEDEKEALDEGATLWRSITQEIGEFEKVLRRALKGSPERANGMDGEENSTEQLLAKIDDLIASVSSAMAIAEAKQWNLLICCLGAELEALQQGRVLLGGQPDKPPLERADTNGTVIDDDPPGDLLNGNVVHRSGSNDSLQDTMKAFSDGSTDKGKQPARSDHDSNISQDPWAPSIGKALSTPPRRDYKSESEDDDEPGPDFLVSHS